MTEKKIVVYIGSRPLRIQNVKQRALFHVRNADALWCHWEEHNNELYVQNLTHVLCLSPSRKIMTAWRTLQSELMICISARFSSAQHCTVHSSLSDLEIIIFFLECLPGKKKNIWCLYIFRWNDVSAVSIVMSIHIMKVEWAPPSFKWKWRMDS